MTVHINLIHEPRFNFEFCLNLVWNKKEKKKKHTCSPWAKSSPVTAQI
jgi:hypothetical protein